MSDTVRPLGKEFRHVIKLNGHVGVITIDADTGMYTYHFAYYAPVHRVGWETSFEGAEATLRTMMEEAPPGDGEPINDSNQPT
jgi:hypothetical protein